MEKNHDAVSGGMSHGPQQTLSGAPDEDDLDDLDGIAR